MSPSEADTTSRSEHLLVIKPGRTDKQYWSDLWTYRELFMILAWRDVAVQYKQTAFGVAWAVVRPLLTTLIFTGIFGGLAGLPSEGAAPYAIMVLAGMLPWFLFSSILSTGAQSLVQNKNLISKVYCPRLIIPVAGTAVALVDFLISLVIMCGMMIYYLYAPDWQILLLPFFTLLALCCALGPALIMCSLNVKYRDFRFIVPFVIQFGLYVSPVGFSSSVIPEQWRLLYSLNPMVGIIDGFRWCILGSEAELYMPGFLVSLTVVAVLLWLGIRVFRATERGFADLV